MATVPRAREKEYSPPPVNGDFYKIADLLDPKERAVVKRVRNGILLENHVGRFVADAEAIYSYEGTREMNTLIVGKSITGLSAFV